MRAQRKAASRVLRADQSQGTSNSLYVRSNQSVVSARCSRLEMFRDFGELSNAAFHAGLFRTTEFARVLHQRLCEARNRSRIHPKAFQLSVLDII